MPSRRRSPATSRGTKCWVSVCCPSARQRVQSRSGRQAEPATCATTRWRSSTRSECWPASLGSRLRDCRKPACQVLRLGAVIEYHRRSLDQGPEGLGTCYPLPHSREGMPDVQLVSELGTPPKVVLSGCLAVECSAGWR